MDELLTNEYKSLIQKNYLEQLKENLKKLKLELSLDTNRMNPDEFLRACDRSTKNYSLVNDYHLIARRQFDRAQNKFDTTYSEWFSEATKFLEKEKNRGKISGQISEKRINNWILKEYKEEYLYLKNIVNEYERVANYLEKQLDAWSKRIKILQTMRNILDRKNIFG